MQGGVDEYILKLMSNIRRSGFKALESELRGEIDKLIRQCKKKDRAMAALREAHSEDLAKANAMTHRMGVAFKKARNHAKEELLPLMEEIEDLAETNDRLDAAASRSAAVMDELRFQLTAERTRAERAEEKVLHGERLGEEQARKLRREMEDRENAQRLRLRVLTEDLEEAQEKLVVKPGRHDLEESLRAVRDELGDMAQAHLQRNARTDAGGTGSGAALRDAHLRRPGSAASSPYLAPAAAAPTTRSSPPRNRTRNRRDTAALRDALSTSPYLAGSRRREESLQEKIAALEKRVEREATRRRAAEERVEILTGIENELTDAEYSGSESDDGGFAIQVRVGSPLEGAVRAVPGFGTPRKPSGGTRSKPKPRPVSRGERERRPSGSGAGSLGRPSTRERERERRPASRGERQPRERRLSGSGTPAARRTSRSSGARDATKDDPLSAAESGLREALKLPAIRSGDGGGGGKGSGGDGIVNGNGSGQSSGNIVQRESSSSQSMRDFASRDR